MVEVRILICVVGVLGVLLLDSAVLVVLYLIYLVLVVLLDAEWRRLALSSLAFVWAELW